MIRTLLTEKRTKEKQGVVMDVGATGSAAAAASNGVARQANSNIETKVQARALDQRKAEGAQVVDMIQKAGSVVDVKA